MKPKWYMLIARAVEEGVLEGMRLAHKHTESPTRDALQDAIEIGVMNKLNEIIHFEEDE